MDQAIKQPISFLALHLHISAPPHKLQDVPEPQLFPEDPISTRVMWSQMLHICRRVHAEKAGWLEMKARCRNKAIRLRANTCLLIFHSFIRTLLRHLFLLPGEVNNKEVSTQKKGRKKKGEREARVGRKEGSQSSCKAAQRAGRQGHLSTEGWELEAKTSSHQNYQTFWGNSRWAQLLQRAGSGQEHPTLFLPSNSWERNQHAPATDGRPKWVEGPMMGLPPFLSGCSFPGTHSAPHLLSVWAPTAFFSWSSALAPFTPMQQDTLRLSFVMG